MKTEVLEIDWEKTEQANLNKIKETVTIDYCYVFRDVVEHMLNRDPGKVKEWLDKWLCVDNVIMIEPKEDYLVVGLGD